MDFNPFMKSSMRSIEPISPQTNNNQIFTDNVETNQSIHSIIGIYGIVSRTSKAKNLPSIKFDNNGKLSSLSKNYIDKFKLTERTSIY